MLTQYNRLTPYKSQVGLPNPVTEVAGSQVQADTQILQGVGAVTKALGGMADQWMKAKFVSDTNTLDTQLAKLTQDYKVLKRKDPVKITSADGSMIDAKIRDWEEYVDGMIIPAIKEFHNGQVGQNAEKEWEGKRVQYRDQIINEAINEDVDYMSKQAVINLNDDMNMALVSESIEDLDKIYAKTTTERNAGNLSREQLADIESRTAMTKHLIETKVGLEGKNGDRSGAMTYEDSLAYVRAQGDMSPADKGVAVKYLQDNEEIRVNKVRSDQSESFQTMIRDQGLYLTKSGETELQQDLDKIEELTFQDKENIHALRKRMITGDGTKDDWQKQDWAIDKLQRAKETGDAQIYSDTFTAVKQHLNPTNYRTYSDWHRDGDTAIQDLVKAEFDRTEDTLKNAFSKEKDPGKLVTSAMNTVRKWYWDTMNNATGPEKRAGTAVSMNDLQNVIKNVTSDAFGKVISEMFYEAENDVKYKTTGEDFLGGLARGEAAGMSAMGVLNRAIITPGTDMKMIEKDFLDVMGVDDVGELDDVQKKRLETTKNIWKTIQLTEPMVTKYIKEEIQDIRIDKKTGEPFFLVGIRGDDGELLVDENNRKYKTAIRGNVVNNQVRLQAQNPNTGKWEWLGEKEGVFYSDTGDAGNRSARPAYMKGVYSYLESEGLPTEKYENMAIDEGELPFIKSLQEQEGGKAAVEYLDLLKNSPVEADIVRSMNYYERKDFFRLRFENKGSEELGQPGIQQGRHNLR